MPRIMMTMARHVGQRSVHNNDRDAGETTSVAASAWGLAA
jgi:hypothetical protein